MTDANCSRCNKTGETLSSENICWNCYNTKEKANYRYMINSRTQLLLATTLVCIFFLLNAIPTIRLGHEFSQNYSKINNTYIKVGKDLFLLTIYLILKLCFVVNLWKSRYTRIGSKYINLVSEFIVLIIKLIVMNHYLSSPLNAEIRLSGLIEKLNQYTDDNLSSEYIAFFLVYGFVFLIIRAFSCILAYVLNIFCESYFRSFYEQQENRRQISSIAFWEFYYHRHPEYSKATDDQSVAAQSEKVIQLDEASLKEDLQIYIPNDEKKLNHYLQYLQSTEDTLSLKAGDLDIYLTYIKDKICLWKEDNLATESHLNHEVIANITNKFNCIKELYQRCAIENQTYFNIYQHYINDFEEPLKQINNERRLTKQAIEQLYMYCDMLYWHAKCKTSVNTTVELFEKQAINLSDYSILLDGETIDYDNIIITNRGIFIIDIETFDSSIPFELLIERDGNWYKRFYNEDSQLRLESLSPSITSTNNYSMLKLEKHLNQLLNRPLDQYIEMKEIVILSNDDMLLENNSTQTVIRVGELVSVLRSYPILFNEEQMLHMKSILVSQQVPTSNLAIPNYRKLIIEPLESLLEKKIQLVQSNADLIHQIDVVNENLSKKGLYHLVPLYVK